MSELNKSQTTNTKLPGFTLVELIVSIAILALMVFGIAQLFPRGLQVGKRAEATTVAANLAQAQLENLLEQDYQTLLVGTIEARHFVLGAYERQTIAEYLEPTNLTVSTYDQGLKRITTTIFYSTAQGERTFRLSTLIAKQ